MDGMSGRKRPTSRRASPRSVARSKAGRADSGQGGHERWGWRRFAGSTWTITVVGGAAAAVIAAVMLAVVTGFLGRVFSHGTASGPSAPIAVNVSLTNPYDGCEGGEGWVIPASPSVLAGYPGTSASENVVNTWVARHNGVPAVGSTITVTVQGTSSSAVILQDVRIEILKRNPPTTGIYPYNTPQCGGVDTRFLSVNLDLPQPDAKVIRGFSATGDLISTSFPLQVSATDPEVFRIERSTLHCNCTWRAVLDWIANGHPSETIIDDHGHPFNETAITNAIRYARDWNQGGRWIACIPATRCRLL